MPDIVQLDVNVPINTWNNRQIFGPMFGPRSGVDLKYTIGIINFRPGTSSADVVLDQLYSDPSPGTGTRDPIGTNIKVKRTVDLRLRFPDAANAPYSAYAGFRPVGISFHRKDGGITSFQTDVGSPVFGLDDPVTPGSYQIPYVQVTVTATSEHRGAMFDYMIVIQDCYGNIGVIDPDIENSAD